MRGRLLGLQRAPARGCPVRPSRQRAGPGPELSKLEVLGVNPAALTRERGALRPYFPTEPFPGRLGLAADPPPAAATPWATTPSLYRARCASGGGATWLQIDDIGGPGETRHCVTQAIGPAWGPHLVDVHIAYGNLVDLVKRKAAAYLDRHPEKARSMSTGTARARR